MEQDDSAVRLKSRLLFTIRRRKEVINNSITERRTAIHKRIRHRRYLFHKIERMHMALHMSRPQTHLSGIPNGSEWWEKSVLVDFGPQDWLEWFHVTKDTFFSLCNTLKPRFAQTGLLANPKLTLPLEKRLAVALICLAAEMDYGLIGELFCVNVPAVGECIREVCDAIIMVLKPLYMHHPTEQELEDNARTFHLKWGFPHCVGVIGTMHVPVSVPTAQDYWSRAGCHAVVLQCVVDGHGRFWDVCVGLPGSTEDAAVLQSSELWIMARDGGLSPQPPRTLMGQPLDYLLLGDAAYPLQKWLLRSYPASPRLTSQQCAFNVRLSHCRTVIARAFQRLRARWQCLSKHSRCHLELVAMMALGSCVLHNVCEARSDPLKEEWLDDVRPGEGPRPSITLPKCMDDPVAEQVRALLCSYFHSRQQGPRAPEPETLAMGAFLPHPRAEQDS
uniref:DDE Tnp4 domain-containing protein n=1 Tax=Denticeps clupeoides TaxID=299321 RepID=A0AAY4CJ70_9TELE